MKTVDISECTFEELYGKLENAEGPYRTPTGFHTQDGDMIVEVSNVYYVTGAELQEDIAAWVKRYNAALEEGGFRGVKIKEGWPFAKEEE